MVTPEEGRVLGCLVEKQLTTPQQYPLTANALAAACSQATNRDPVTDLDEDAVLLALQGLKEQRLVRFVLPSMGRSVVRYRHVVDEVLGLDSDDLALLAVLVLRGAQTPGELRGRTARMHEFPTVADVEARLDALAAREEPLVRALPRRPGQKEDRWLQLLAAGWGAPAPSDLPPRPPADGAPVGGGDARGAGAGDPTPSDGDAGGGSGRGDVEALRSEVAGLRQRLAEVAEEVRLLREGLGG